MNDRAAIEPVTVHWDAPSHAVLIRFRGFAEGEILHRPCDAVIDLLISRRSSRLISDSREMKAMTQEDQRWIDEDWRPRARIAGLRLSAVVVPKSVVAQLSLTAIAKKLDDLQYGYFSELDEARKWLKQS
ncbi:MAG TPA: hypothetical protein VE093_23595 [Polyangiaceae bacterium]|nr:hypothetical protein [Polyangiaceae bacterium]